MTDDGLDCPNSQSLWYNIPDRCFRSGIFVKGEIGVSETRQTRTDPLRGMVGGLLCVQLSTEPVLLFVDRRLAQQMGLPPAGTPVRDLIPAEDWRPLVTQLHEALTEENELRFTARILPVPGEAPVEVHCSGRRWENLLWLAVALAGGLLCFAFAKRWSGFAKRAAAEKL